jgi:hypothetical protein
VGTALVRARARPKSEAISRVSAVRAACIDEGALSFVTTTYPSYRDSPYKREWGRHNDERPSSKPALLVA